MRPSRRLLLSVAAVGASTAGCDAVPAAGSRDAAVGGPLIAHDLALVIAGVVLATTLAAFVAVLHQLIRHGALARRLARGAEGAEVLGLPVRLVRVPGIALVAGLRRPATYLSADVIEVLERDELAAVLLHERHHQVSRAPVRLAVLSGIADVFGVVPALGRAVARRRAGIEVEADSFALANGSSRSSIAWAILKLSRVEASHADDATFAAAVDIRLRVLLEDATEAGPSLRDDVVVAAMMVLPVTVACSLLLT